MKTHHSIHYKSSTEMNDIQSSSVDLIVTSPPYPMIEMWDEIFSKQNVCIQKALDKKDGTTAFELMHKHLDLVWAESYRVLKEGGFVCINIGDATRTINGNFALYPNHMRILKFMMGLGFTVLPCILWRKQTNAPNKFMGSGMLPAGAYATLEHEYILIFRKGPKREFKKDRDKKKRYESAIFWEERNAWYSDVWFDIKGSKQILKDKEDRLRSGAYPFDIVYRIINMYSVKDDIVLDPFLGTGTTIIAAITSGRNSLGYEIDISMRHSIMNSINAVVEYSNNHLRKRIQNHISFVKTRIDMNKNIKYFNKHYQFPVVTSQEKEILFNEVISLKEAGDSNSFDVIYSEKPQTNCIYDNAEDNKAFANVLLFEKHVERKKRKISKQRNEMNQLTLFS